MRYFLIIMLAVAMFVAMTTLGCVVVMQRDVPQREIPWPFGKDKDDRRKND